MRRKKDQEIRNHTVIQKTVKRLQNCCSTKKYAASWKVKVAYSKQARPPCNAVSK